MELLPRHDLQRLDHHVLLSLILQLRQSGQGAGDALLPQPPSHGPGGEGQLDRGAGKLALVSGQDPVIGGQGGRPEGAVSSEDYSRAVRGVSFYQLDCRNYCIPQVLLSP